MRGRFRNANILAALAALAAAILLPGPPAEAIGGPSGGFTVPAGLFVTFTNVAFGACNNLSWGYEVNGTSTVVGSKAAGCFSQAEPNLTIGPFASNATLRVFLKDNTCGDTYYSDGTPVDHVIIAGSDPQYSARFADAGGFCERATAAYNTFSGSNFAATLCICQPSGASWVTQWPTSRSTSDLVEPFRTNANNFLSALAAAGATVHISATYRPPQRAYLMHWAWMIGGGQDPRTVPDFSGPTAQQRSVPAYRGPDTVAICWVHLDSSGNPDLGASLAAAQQMVAAYGIVYQPALDSEHSLGTAIDMSISWKGSLKIKDAAGTVINIHTKPRSGLNSELWAVGASYGVIKLASDAPHWSIDGH